MSNLQPITSARLYRVIADQLRCRIRAGVFPSRSRLPSERELAQQMAVSRTSVREALIVLELEGLVEIRVGTGVFVSEINFDIANSATSDLATSAKHAGFHEMHDMRMLVEPHCAALAAIHATSEQIETIYREANALCASSERFAADSAFHSAVADAAQNAYLAASVQILTLARSNNRILSRLEAHFIDDVAWEAAQAEHLVIAAAIARRASDEAKIAMSEHLTRVAARVTERDF